LQILVRADASPSIGGGHIIRMLALCDEFKLRGAKINFACSKETLDTVRDLSNKTYSVTLIPDEKNKDKELEFLEKEFGKDTDLLIIDHYQWNESVEKHCKKWAGQIFVVDDMANNKRECDYLLNSSLGWNKKHYSRLVPSTCKLFLGPSYALLSSSIRIRRMNSKMKQTSNINFSRIVVSMGLTDPENMTFGIVDALIKKNMKYDVDVIVGRKLKKLNELKKLIDNSIAKINLYIEPDNYIDILSSATLVIGAAGNSSWERSCLGLPSIIIAVAENQEHQAKMIEASGAGKYLGVPSGNSFEKIVNISLDYLSDTNKLNEIRNKALSLCDGLGAARIASELTSKIKATDLKDVSLRPATYEDGEQMYVWQKDHSTRKYARNQSAPTREEHFSWFSKKMADPYSLLNLILYDNDPVGVLRLDLMDKHSREIYEISINIDAGFRGLGIAAAALKYLRFWLPKANFYALVQKDNIVSHKLFSSSGFQYKGGSYWSISDGSDLDASCSIS